MNQNNGDEAQSLQRLKRLSDCIFMLAMTLMVLQFDWPDVESEMSTRNNQEFLITQLPAFYIYLGTFILITFYKIGIESFIEAIVSLLAIFVSLINPVYWEWSFFAIFPLSLIL